MEVTKVIPMMIMSGIGYRGKDAAGERFKGFFGAKDRYVTMQRMTTIIDVVQLQIASGDELGFHSQGELERWIRRNVGIKGGGDATRDMWGQTYRFAYDGVRLTLLSAGPDGVHGNGDDLKVAANLQGF